MMKKLLFTILIAAILYLLVIGAFIIVLISIPLAIAATLYRKFIYKKKAPNSSRQNNYNEQTHNDNDTKSKKHKVIEADYIEIKK